MNSAYNAVNGTFCSENKQILTDVLREQWGYDGFVVTDWGAVKDRVKGLEAGLDLEMPGGGGVQDAAIVKAVRDGELDEAMVAEAVQLYVGEINPGVARPVRELKGFEKIFLAPGEEKTVSFSLDSRSFAYYEPRIHDWFVESGKYVVEVGSSSRDIRLSGEIAMTGSREIPIHYTRTSTIGDLLKSAKGRAFMEQMMQKLHGSEEAKKAEADNLNNMGEGSERMAQAMMIEMPLGAIVTFGRMTDEQLDGLIAMLNS